MIQRKINSKTKISSFIWISIFANAMSFFGFLYEQIDFIPNYFFSPLSSKIHWSQFHLFTNPAHYHVIHSLFSISCLIVLWIYNQNFNVIQIKKLKIISLNTLLVNCITGIAVNFVNNKLFFDEPVSNAEALVFLASIWAILNMLRLIFLGLNIFYLMAFFRVDLVLNETNTQ